MTPTPLVLYKSTPSLDTTGTEGAPRPKQDPCTVVYGWIDGGRTVAYTAGRLPCTVTCGLL